MIRRLDKREFDEVFNIMEKSFPDDEYRTYEEQKNLLDNPYYQIYVADDAAIGSIKAFIAVWEFDSIAFIEHFAVNSAYRNCGIGADMLSELFNVIGKRMCLEVELPENDMSLRRIGFYKRNNFFLNNYPYEQPPISKGKNAIPLLIMTSERAVDEDEFNKIKSLLYTKVYKIQ